MASDGMPLDLRGLVQLITDALSEHPGTIDVHGGPAFGDIEVRTDCGTFRVRVSENPT